MTLPPKPLALVAACCFAAPLCAAITPPQFHGLGDLAGGTISSTASGISDDGLKVTGESSSSLGPEAFIWTTGGTMVGLGDFPNSPFKSSASSLSADGSAAAGIGAKGVAFLRAGRWTQATGWVDLGTLTPDVTGFKYSEANGISNDGLKICGTSIVAGVTRAFLQTSTTPTTGTMISLGTLTLTPSGGAAGDTLSRSSEARGISGNGQVVLGTSGYTVSRTVTISPPPIPIYDYSVYPPVIIGYQQVPPYQSTTVIAQAGRAFSWSAAGGMIDLGDLPGGPEAALAKAASFDGTVIVGYGTNAAGQEGVVWSGGAMTPIGDLPGGDHNSNLFDISADGTVAVGRGSESDGTTTAIVWDATHGIRKLSSLLAASGIGLADWTLTEVTAISGDADVIVGNGINPLGHPEAWRISGVQALLNPVPAPPITLIPGETGLSVQFTTEPGFVYQLYYSNTLDGWETLGQPFSTAAQVGSIVHSVIDPEVIFSSPHPPKRFYQLDVQPAP